MFGKGGESVGDQSLLDQQVHTTSDTHSKDGDWFFLNPLVLLVLMEIKRKKMITKDGFNTKNK